MGHHRSYGLCLLGFSLISACMYHYCAASHILHVDSSALIREHIKVANWQNHVQTELNAERYFARSINVSSNFAVVDLTFYLYGESMK